MRIPILMGLCCLYILPTDAQNYNVSLLADSLRTNAHAVKRAETFRISIHNRGKATLYHQYAVTILNEAGADQSFYSREYDKFISVSNISGNLYDANGAKINTLKKKEILDNPASDDESLITDSRVKRHSFYYRNYPYTIEYTEELELNGLFQIPGWTPIDDMNYSVEQSRFIVETPPAFPLHYKQIHYIGEPRIQKGDKLTTYEWQLSGLKAIEKEAFQPPIINEIPGIYITAGEFSIDNYNGNMNSWNDIGKFIYQLNQGRDQLPAPVKQEVHQLTDGLSTTESKVAVLYHYLQQNTRYISVQLGIGGWQSFDANYVATKHYGDCKALTNYMYSLLKEAGIFSCYALVNAGTNARAIWEDFPQAHFNHVILCVPNGQDSIWLECTNQHTPAGYMGSFTGNRKALLILAEGSKLVNTPSYSSENNLQYRTVKASVNEKGDLQALVYTHFTGVQQELPAELLHEASADQVKKYLNNVLDLPTYEIKNYAYKEASQPKLPAIEETLSLDAPAYASLTGKRLFINMNLFNKSGNRLNNDNPRIMDIYYNYAYKDMDSVFLRIPEGYKIESIPNAVNIENKFGIYHLQYTVQNNSLVMIRTQLRKQAIYPASDYPDFVDYYDKIYKADRTKVVLAKE